MHPRNLRDSHGSDVVVVVIQCVARERLGEASTSDSVVSFQDVDVGNSYVFQHHCGVETGSAGSNDAHTTLVRIMITLEMIRKRGSFAKSVAVLSAALIKLREEVLVQDVLCICRTERCARSSRVERSVDNNMPNMVISSR
jgi:hypothetical protein